MRGGGFITNNLNFRGDYKSNWPDVISDYTDNIAEYRGKGKIYIENKHDFDCEFKIIQTRDGTILSLCNFIDEEAELFPLNNIKIISMSGETIEGHEILTEGPITFRSSQFSGSRECQIVFLARSVKVKMVDDIDPKTVVFGITNFEFDSNCWIEEISSPEIIIPRQVKALELNLQSEEVIIRQVLDYEKIIKKLNTFETIDVTCEASIAITRIDEIEKKQSIIDNLCYLLSVARGTKINWIYYKIYNDEKLLFIAHQNRITKGFNSSHAAIIDRYDMCDVKNFLENTYDTYISRKKQYQLDKGTIDLYLDAKATGDYLETKGAKLSVAMEKLKSVYLDSKTQVLVENNTESITEYIMDEDSFKMHKKIIKKFLESYLEKEKINENKRGKIYKNISCINRTSFEDILRNLWEDIALNLDDNSICLFINSRNSLVHQGKFYCKIEKPVKKCPPLHSPADEYFFLVNILDKTMLKLLGYDGFYYNLYRRDFDSV